jgi:hypothetical protein
MSIRSAALLAASALSCAVVPAQAGTHAELAGTRRMDLRLRGDDGGDDGVIRGMAFKGRRGNATGGQPALAFCAVLRIVSNVAFGVIRLPS